MKANMKWLYMDWLVSCPSEEKVGLGGPTNKEAGVRANVMSSTFKQFLLEA